MNEEEKWQDYEDYVRYHMKLMVTPPMTREQYSRWQAQQAQRRNEAAIKRYWESYEERDNEVDSDNS